MLEYGELLAFKSVAKNLNFSKAAKEIGLSAPQLSKIIANLEDKLKSKLFDRTTRNVRLTNEGQCYLNVANKAIDTMIEANNFFDSRISSKELTGSIRITAPNTLGTRFLAKTLLQFSEKYPKVKIQIILNDHYLDFMDAEIDLALRVMKSNDSSLIARKISSNPISFYASPLYLAKITIPKTIADLQLHPTLVISSQKKLVFRKSKIALEKAILDPQIECTNGDLLVELALQGNGLLVRSEWGVKKEVTLGLLVKIDLDDELISESDIYIVYPKHKYTNARVKAFITLLHSNLNNNL